MINKTLRRKQNIEQHKRCSKNRWGNSCAPKGMLYRILSTAQAIPFYATEQAVHQEKLTTYQIVPCTQVDVRFVFISSCLLEGSCLIYASIRIVVSNTYCCVFVLFFPILCTLCCQFLWIKAKNDNFAISLYCFMVDMHCLYINKCQRIPQGQSKMNNQEKLPTQSKKKRHNTQANINNVIKT